jgi:hypothetical protein
VNFTSWEQLSALKTGKTTPEQALKFEYLAQIEALKTGKVTPEQALNVTNKYQVEALSANATYSQALKFISWEQLSVLNDGYSPEIILSCSNYSTVGNIINCIDANTTEVIMA